MSAQKQPKISLFPSPRHPLVLASHNAGKLQELNNLLHPFGYDLISAAEMNLVAPDEIGRTFDANATLKARHACEATGLWSLADDSGLEVTALGGLPGVNTADYGGWERLLKALQHVPEGQRHARFVCSLALQRPDQDILIFRGECVGEITLEAHGSKGFGYDPVFQPLGEPLTFAAMSTTRKNILSHRGKALQLLLRWLSTHQNAPHA